MEFLGDPKNSKGEIRENWNYLKIRIWERYLQNGIWEIIFKNQIWRNPRISHGLKVAMQTMQQGVWSRWQMDSWVNGVDSLPMAIAAPSRPTSTLNTQLAWPNMAPIGLFPSTSYMCIWSSYIHSLLARQTCRNQDSQWRRRFEFQPASPHPCTNEQTRIRWLNKGWDRMNFPN